MGLLGIIIMMCILTTMMDVLFYYLMYVNIFKPKGHETDPQKALVLFNPMEQAFWEADIPSAGQERSAVTEGLLLCWQWLLLWIKLI